MCVLLLTDSILRNRVVTVFIKNLIKQFFLLFLIKCDRWVILRSLQETSRQGTHDIIGKPFCTTHHHKTYSSSEGRESSTEACIFPFVLPAHRLDKITYLF